MTNASKEFEKMKEVIDKIGLPTLVIFTFGYFIMMFLTPLILLSIVAEIFKVSIVSSVFTIFATALFLTYFAFDLFRIVHSKFTLTMAIIIPIALAILIAIKVFNNTITLLQLDESTPRQFRDRVFPLNLM